MNSSSLTRSNWFSNVGESMSSRRRKMTSSLVMLRTSFAMRFVSTLDRWLMISVLAASAAESSSSEDQLVWLGAGDVLLHPLKGSQQSPQVLWCLSHLIWQRRCTYCLQQGSWTLRSQVSDFRWHTKHSYSLVTTSGSSCFSLLLCRSAFFFFYINIKYISGWWRKTLFFMTCMIPLSFSSSSCRLVVVVVVVVLICLLKLKVCEECDFVRWRCSFI